MKAGRGLAGGQPLFCPLDVVVHDHPGGIHCVQQIRDLDLGPNPAAGPSWDQLRGMTYLNWAVREALRLNPPVATNSREAVRDTVLPTGGGPDGTSPTVVLKGTILRYQAVSTSKSMTPPFPSTTGPD